MKLPAFIRLTIRNVRVNMDPGTMMFMLGLPALYLAVLGVMYEGIITSVPSSGGPVSYMTFLAPGVIGMEALTAGNIGGGMLWADRRWGMLEQILVGPFRRIDYLMGIMLLAVIFAIGGSTIMALIAFDTSAHLFITPLNILLLVVTLAIGTIFFSSLFLILAIRLKSMNAYNTVTIVLFFFLDFASSSFYPITSKTPFILQVFVNLNPLSYIVYSARDILSYNLPNAALQPMLVI
ncbi:membrane protein containing ABC-2 type transporter domain protein, partial [mine drainage metagenome]